MDTVNNKLVSDSMATTEIKYYSNDSIVIERNNKLREQGKQLDEDAWDESTVTPLGSSLMVVPADSYVLRMDFEMTGSDGSKKTGHTEVPLSLQKAPQTFLAGNEYTVRVMVYGLQEIQTTIRIPSRIQGGEVLIDTDDGETEIYY